MKKISKRAWMALALAAALLAGLLVFFGEYFIEAKTWVAFPGSPHVYTGVNPDCGKIYDRSGMLLLNTNDGRVYNADEAVRRATLHLLGDRDGYISAPLLQTYASKMIGFDVVNGLYTDEPGSVAARLTISAAVQSAAQQALSGYRGTIGVYNYKTGEILCAVTSPSYDPDHVPDVANDTTGSYEGVYVNRFFDAAYTPGSIFKLVTAAAALETIEGVQSRTFQCSGKTIIGGQEIICNGVHGSLSLAGALAHSCNVAFGELAAELGAGGKAGADGEHFLRGLQNGARKDRPERRGRRRCRLGRYRAVYRSGRRAGVPSVYGRDCKRRQRGRALSHAAREKGRRHYLRGGNEAYFGNDPAGDRWDADEAHAKRRADDLRRLAVRRTFRLRQIRHGRARGADGKRDVRGLCAGCILSGGVRGVRGKRRRGKHGRGAYGGKGAWRLRAGAAIGIKSKDAAQPRFSCVGGAFVV